MALPTDLESLAELCLATSKTIKTYFDSHGLPPMSFDQNGPLAFPPATPEIQMARMQLRMAAKTLYDLASGPDEIVTWDPFCNLQDMNSFRYIYTYDIARLVPLNSAIAYPELAAKAKVDVGQLQQMLRHAMTARVFSEPQPGHVAHTASSRLLMEDGPRHWNAYVAEDCLPIAGKQIEAIQKWGHGSQEPTQSAMNLAYDTDLQMFPFFMSSGQGRMERFSKLMQAVATQPGYHSSHVTAGFDWPSLGAATVVDVGGNTGHASVAIAEAAPQVQCIVQDLPSTIAHATDPASSVVPEHLRDRIRFMPHNFYDPQPVEADVYFVRLIMHDYPDAYCVKILQALVPKMKPTARLILMDQILPPVGVVPAPAERVMRCMDLSMMMLSNAKERGMAEWMALLKAADPRLVIKNAVTPPGSIMSVIEVVLQDGT